MPMDPQYGLAPAASSVAANAYGLEPVTSAPAPNRYGLQAVTVPQSDNKYGLVPATESEHDPNARFAFGQGEIRSYEPSVWERIKSAVTAGIPRYSSRTVYNEKYGEMQLLSLEEWLTPSEQRAHPIATGVAEFAGGLTSPESTALLAGTAGLGELPGAAAMLPRLMSAGFGAQAIYSGIKTVPAIRDAWNRGDASEVERLLTHTVLNLGMGALAGQHAVSTRGAITGRVKEGATARPETPGVETHAVEPSSPVGEVLQEHAPSVRVVDSSAAARELIEKETTIRPAQEGGDRRIDVARRQRVSEMSPEEMQRELLTSKVTGLPNRRAFDEAGPSPAVAMSDADGLKAVNDKFGYAAGDALLHAKAEALRQAGVDAYHDKGDEFVYRGQSPAELTEKLETARDLLRNRIIDVRNPDGTVTSFKGADFSYGAGQDITEAESGLKEHKTQREAAGERARGELRGITQLGPSESGGNPSAAQRLGQDPAAEARVTGPSGTAEFRNTARVVSDDHIPVVSRDQVLAQAVQNIINNSGELRRVGVDPSTIQTHGDIQSALQIASDHIASNLDPRASAVITLEGQKALASELGLSVEDLLARRQGQTFNAEELVAARALLKASSDSVISRAGAAAASGDDASLNAFSTALSQHKAIEETIAGARAEAGRALGSFRVGDQDLPQTKITNILSKLTPEAQAEAARLIGRLDATDPASVRRLNEFVEQITPRTTLEKLHEYYRNALLSSPHTIVVKTASEAAMVGLETMKKAVAGGVSKFKDSPDRFAAESWYYAKGMAQALAEHVKPILGGEFQLEGSPGFEKASTQAIKGRLGSVIRVPSEAMSRMTNLLYAGNYFGELQALAARQALSEGLEGDAFHARQEYLAHQPTEDMSEAAHKLATTNTFQNQLSGFAGRIQQAISAKPDVPWLPESLKSVSPLKFLFPFYRTPVNLLKATFTHATPYELLNGIARGDTDAMARGILGSSISAALGYLALTGHLTGGGPIDFKKEETLRATGWQPYSVRIGNRYYSYRRFEPVALAAALIADGIHGMMHGDSETISQSKADLAVRHVMRSLDDFPFLGTLSNLLQAIHDPVGGRAESFVNRMAGSLVPAAIANLSETIDPTVRRPQNPLQAIAGRIPGLTHFGPGVVDITGHTVRRQPSALGGANPFEWSTDKGDKVVAELAKLGISTSLPPTKLKWRGKTVQLTNAERQQFAMQEGREFYADVAKLMQSPSWERRSEDQKRKAIGQVHRVLEEARPQKLTRMRRAAESAKPA